jgi:hypothetical protein
MVFHHGGRNLEIAHVRWIHMDATWPSASEHPKNFRRNISIGSGLGFEHGDHGWKTLDEQSVVETLNGGFDHLRRMKF